MKTKVYEIVMPSNSSSFFWKKDGKMYHIQDQKHPYSFDLNDSTYQWSSKLGIEKTKRDPIPKLFVQVLAIANKPDEIQAFVDLAIKAKDSATMADGSPFYGPNDNVIVVHRQINADLLLIGYCIDDAITDSLMGQI